MSNKLLCTFSPKDDLDRTIDGIMAGYVILYSRIFILESTDSDEYLCTYNIQDAQDSSITLPNTILLHRKKESNTLYTINSLNLLIKQLNDNILSRSYQINWNNYRNTALLTSGADLRQLVTTIHKIVTI